VTQDLQQLKSILQSAQSEVAKVVIGQEEAVRLALITVFTGHHALIEGVPGIAKTLLVRTLAHVLGCDFSRIQFTPDLMPTDITGTNVYNMKDMTFSLVKGPVFTSFLLADEINRAPAKTQSALLQAMQERTVTIDRETLPLSPDFTVFATQNPVEYGGTYPLPEAQKDRFMLKITMGPPSESDELALAARYLAGDSPEQTLKAGQVRAVLQEDQLRTVRRALAGITVREELVAYVVAIVRKSRAHDAILVGASPRATEALLLGSRAAAAVDDRDFVTPDDIKSLARASLAHRIILRPEYEIEGLTSEEAVDQILQEVPVPR
jgi:MoxR-like ATPase